jgi:hypothetical protein
MKRNLVVSLLFACAVNYAAAIALVGLGVTQAQGSGGPCSGKPCEIPNLFDPDLADLKSSNNAGLNDFTKGALESTKGSNKDMDRDCYPLPITITVFTRPLDDTDLQNLIMQSRMEALMNYFTAQGLDPHNIEQVTALGPDKVEGTYNDVDRDPPVIKMTSTPEENSKVTPGEKIQIHATVSERHADGHKSWPSGVKSLQLIANGTVVESESKDFGLKPPPCEVRRFEPIYTVPPKKDTPDIVRLVVYAEDATGHGTSKEADFPTHGDWYGRLDWSVHQMVPTGPQDWLGHADLILDDDGQGGLTGTLSGTERQKLDIEGCHGVTTWTIQARLTGTITSTAKRITINVMDRKSTRPEMASCGEARTGGDIFSWRHFNEMFQKLTPSADGRIYEYHRDITVSNGSGVCTLIVRELQTKK